MKKVFLLLLCLLVPFAALAENFSDVQVSFTPIFYPLEGWGVSLGLPEDWTPLALLDEDTDRGVTFAVADAENRTNLTVTALELENGGDMDAAKALLTGQSDYQDVEELQLGALTFLAYDREEAEEFGFLLPLDGGYALDFRFACTPADADALGTLPLEIICTVRMEDEE